MVRAVFDVTVPQELVQRQEEEAEALWANFETLRSAQEMVAHTLHLWRSIVSEISSGLNNAVRFLEQLCQRVQQVLQAVLQESSSGHQRGRVARPKINFGRYEADAYFYFGAA